MRGLWVCLSFLIVIACEKPEPKAIQTTVISSDTLTKPIDTVKKPPVTIPVDTNKGRQLSYLALGDSYTIGESVSRNEIFPQQLVSQVARLGKIINSPTLIAQTGWTTSDLKYAIKHAGITKKFDIVTLLIGVNNQYGGDSKETYRKEFRELLQSAIDLAGGDKSHVFVISIPDWGATPFGRQRGNPQEIGADIDAFNAINNAETIALNISYTDITPASRLAAGDDSLVAVDGLHPSGKMYLDWASKLAPIVVKSLD